MKSPRSPKFFALTECRWSFGGNRLQIKAEVRLIADVREALKAVSALFSKAEGNLQSLAAKQDLLIILLEDEQTRLTVWLYPLEHEKRHTLILSHSGSAPSDVSRVYRTSKVWMLRGGAQSVLSNVLKTAWAEHPSLAVHLKSRFASPKLANDVRFLLLKYPERALEEPDALQILIGPSLPLDVSFQLKVSRVALERKLTWLTSSVFTILERGQSCHCSHILLARIS